MADKVEFSSNGTNGAGEIELPAGEGRAPALILVHEWWGLNDHVRSLVSRFAKEGFLTLAIDLYDGKTTKDAAEAGKLMGALDWGRAVGIAAAALEYLKAHPRSNGNVGCTGFCMGGAATLVIATNVPGIKAAVPFYGMPDASKVDYAKLSAPILMHVAKRDEWVKPELAEALRDKLTAEGKSMRLEQYEADHAFVNDTRPEVYSKENAELALSRSYAFLKEKLT
jgi:carboxymethylenebutenolidase